MNIIKKILIFLAPTFFLILGLSLFCLIAWGISHSFTAEVIDSADDYLIVELEENNIYRFYENSSYSKIKLYTDKAQNFSAGDRLFAYTSDGREDSSPPGIAGKIVIKLP